MSALQFATLTLVDRASYQTNVNIFGRPLLIQFSWNERQKSRYILIKDSFGDTLLQNSLLITGNELELNFNAKNEGYNVTVMLQRKLDRVGDVNMLNWKESHFISFKREYETDE